MSRPIKNAPSAPPPESLSECQRILRYQFQRPELLAAALTHASAVTDRSQSNERLEFLGDAVLGLIICRHVYELFPVDPEGRLTTLKSAVVSRKTCAQVSQTLGLPGYMRVGAGVARVGRLPISLVAGVLEAVIGAIYLDGGLEAARPLVLRHMQAWIDRYAASAHQDNYKSMLQQYVQRTLGRTPEYRIVRESGPDHHKSFHIQVCVGAREFESATGPTKQQAEQQAALRALATLGVLEAAASGSEEIPGGE